METPSSETATLMKVSLNIDPSLEQVEKNEKRWGRSPIKKRKNGEKSHDYLAHQNTKQKLRGDKFKLKSILTKVKTQKMKENYLYKLQLNSAHRKPADYGEDVGNFTDEESSSSGFFSSLEGFKAFKMGNIALTIWTLINIIHSTIMVFLFSSMMTFPETLEDELFYYLRVSSLGIYFFDAVLNCIIERYEGGKIYQNIGELCSFYIKNIMAIDLISVAIFTLDLLFPKTLVSLATLASLVRFFSNKKKFEKLEYLYVSSTQREQYYGLIKVFLTNFSIGHILSILLNLMARLSVQNSWWVKINIINAEWYIKYIWGYYWGTNIMLTVGFGDLSANNYYQAIILIFIQTFSCITLAYNISYVGALIGSIREKEQEKKKKLKFFHKMCEQNQISEELESKITNYIEESYEVKEAFCYQEYDQVIQSLPNDMQLDYRKQANKIVFDGLGFLNNLSNKSLLKMAELVERKICHPNEYVLRKGSKAQFMILQKGKLCYCCKVNRCECSLDGKIIETLSVSEHEKPKMISLDFIKNRPVNYDIKSDNYSIIYTINLEDFKKSLKSSDMDYQLYCLLRDRDQCYLDEDNIYLCDVCKDKYHTKFECSRLHYRPLKQMVNYHYFSRVRRAKCKRSPFQREKDQMKTLHNAQYAEMQYKKYAREYLGEEQMKEITRKREATLETFDRASPLFKSTDKLKNIFSTSQILDKLQEIINSNIIEKKFWEIESDEACNFHFYFKNSNPDNLTSSTRNKQKKKTFASYFEK